MRITSLIAAAFAGVTAFAAAPASAGEVILYPYATSANYCPAGLQPIVLNGVICCGRPNTHVSYQQVMRHPVRARYSQSCRPGDKGCSKTCEEGEKGCF